MRTRPMTRRDKWIAPQVERLERRFVARGVEAAHRGGHALRHACAVRLLAEGLTLKEVGDHLGHRSTSATSTYAKVNMVALREVGAFDLGDVLSDMTRTDRNTLNESRNHRIGERVNGGAQLFTDQNRHPIPTTLA